MTEPDPIMMVFPKREVKALDMRPFLRRFSKDVLPKGPELARLMGRFHFIVHGYDDDPHEVYAIEAIRTFYQTLLRKWPYWFFFCDLRGEGLMMMTACCMKQLSGAKHTGNPTANVVLDPVELLQFVSAEFTPMNEMFERAGMSERAIYNRTAEIMRYYNFPFDVPAPD